MRRMRTWLDRHRDIVANTTSLLSSTLATSGLGFAFWFLAARLFDPQHVGLASAAVAAMLMLSTMGVMGLDALLVSEIGHRLSPPMSAQVGGLVRAGVAVSFLTSATLGLLFAAMEALLSPGGNLGLYFEPGWPTYLVFAVGVGLTGVGIVFDRVTIGLLRGGIQLARNAVFSVLKLVLLPILLWWGWLELRVGESIYALWALTTLVSLLVVLPWFLRTLPRGPVAPAWGVLLRLRGAAWWHHLVNLAQHGPGLVTPVLVAALIAPDVNAAFYITWMLIAFARAVPWHLTTVLHAVGARDRDLLSDKLRVTLRLSGFATVAIAVVVAVAADPLLRFFGPAYAELAAPAFRILALSVIPLAIKEHFFALTRILGFTRRATVVGGLIGVVELAAIYFAARTGSLTVISWALLAALVAEALVLLPLVLRYLRRDPG